MCLDWQLCIVASYLAQATDVRDRLIAIAAGHLELSNNVFSSAVEIYQLSKINIDITVDNLSR